jgi:hypothetical protein
MRGEIPSLFLIRIKIIFMSFTPQRILITGITNANPAVVTCATSHNLTTGQCIRLNIPKSYGMQEINNQIVQITNLTLTTFSLQFNQNFPSNPVDSTNFSAFVNAGTGTPAAYVPVGSKPSPVTNTDVQVLNNVCDSLINDSMTNTSISPIPF